MRRRLPAIALRVGQRISENPSLERVIRPQPRERQRRREELRVGRRDEGVVGFKLQDALPVARSVT